MSENDSFKRLTNDVHQDRTFWMADGTSVRNLKELDTALEGMREETFNHHVNDAKHDFSNWVRDVIQDQKLADNLANSKDKRSVQVAVLRRIIEAMNEN